MFPGIGGVSAATFPKDFLVRHVSYPGFDLSKSQKSSGEPWRRYAFVARACSGRVATVPEEVQCQSATYPRYYSGIIRWLPGDSLGRAAIFPVSLLVRIYPSSRDTWDVRGHFGLDFENSYSGGRCMTRADSM